MKLTIVGGGGFRVPLVYRALGSDSPIDEVALYDVDPDRLRVIEAVLAQMDGPRVTATTDLHTAVEAADFVFAAIRVGGLPGRVVDEQIPLAHGLLGQETIGAGGIAYGLRTIPVALRIARVVAERAPDAWFINFTNPAGMVTEALQAILGDRVIGICDAPVGLYRRVARALGIDERRARFDYFGLNHLGWLRHVYVDGHDRLPGLLADDAALTSFEEGALFAPDELRALGMIPNEYVYFYAHADAAVAAIAGRGTSRGEFLLAQQRAFYAGVPADPAHALNIWEATLHQRNATYMAEGREAAGAEPRDQQDVEGGGYEGVALALMRAIADNANTALTLNVRNRSAIPALPADAVVEVPCLVGANGALPIAVGDVPQDAAALLRQVKDVERRTIAAAVQQSKELALQAFALHPLVGSMDRASELLTGYLQAMPRLLSD